VINTCAGIYSVDTIKCAFPPQGQQADASHSMDVLSQTTLAPASGGGDGGTDEGPEDD
jgi:hypothetical protein